MKLTVGCDPEVFLFDMAANRIIPACGLIGGTKTAPLDIGNDVMVQEDNVTIEFNTKPVEHEPGSNALCNVGAVAFQKVWNYVQTKNRNYDLFVQPDAQFPTEILAKTPGAMTFGCDPDLDAHMQGGKNPVFTPEQVGNYRFAGGHIHLGYDVDECPIPKYALVQLCDALVTVPYFAQNFDFVGKVRSQYYGRAGAYRDKSYGFEYRTPSAKWLQGGQYARRICDLVHWAINNPSEARQKYDLINFNNVKMYIAGQLSSKFSPNLIADCNRHSEFLAKFQERDDEDAEVGFGVGAFIPPPAPPRNQRFLLDPVARRAAQQAADALFQVDVQRNRVRG